MKTIVNLLLTAVVVVVLSKILPGVVVEGYGSAIVVAVVIALLRFLVKPILVVLTLPITLITFGLFLWIINALIIVLAARLIDGFAVKNLWWALLFALLLSFLQSFFRALLKKDDES